MRSASGSTFGMAGYTSTDRALSFCRQLAPAQPWRTFPPTHRTRRNEPVVSGYGWASLPGPTQPAKQKPADDGRGEIREDRAEPDNNYDNPPSPARKIVHGASMSRRAGPHHGSAAINKLGGLASRELG